MDYDKTSFLAGLSVGKTLKGWGSGGPASNEEPPHDGKTRLYITIPVAYSDKLPPPVGPITLRFSQTVSNGVLINWGDGSDEETVSGTGGPLNSRVSCTHTYAFGGEYIVTLSPADGCTLGFGDDGDYSPDTIEPISLLYKVYLGNSVKLEREAFSYSYRLEKVYMYPDVTLGTWSFANCSSLKTVTMAENLVDIPMFSFYYCEALETIKIPDHVETIRNSAFSHLRSNRILVIPHNVRTIGLNTFDTSAFHEIHFLSQAPPDITSSTLGGHKTIYVPKGSLEAYKTAEHWADRAELIKEEP